jgi:hypothetical protein
LTIGRSTSFKEVKGFDSRDPPSTHLVYVATWRRVGVALCVAGAVILYKVALDCLLFDFCGARGDAAERRRVRAVSN